MKENILKQFDESNSLYMSLGEKCKGILIELLKDNSIPIHHINSRTKDRVSLSKKIDSKKNKYTDISEITDISGIRIITYLESDVNKVAEIINKEFEIDPINSVDKRKLKTDQFGYKSLHYVASLNKERSVHSENKKYIGFKLEIQIRSILQHAWAEIEHDLGYKGEIAIPESFKRNFNRLAALLETADIEFDRLKNDLSSYEINIKKIIEKTPDEVRIDQASLISFTLSNKVFEKARKIIKKNVKCEFSEIGHLGGELERFKFFNINTIGELERLINNNEKHYLAFVDEFTKDISERMLYNSLPLFYFQHFLASKKNSIEYLDEYFSFGEYKMAGTTPSQRFIDTFNLTK